MDAEILDSIWFTSLYETIGMVAIKSGDGWKAYIGTARGDDEKADEQHIAQHGAKVPRYIAYGAFMELDKKKFVY